MADQQRTTVAVTPSAAGSVVPGPAGKAGSAPSDLLCQADGKEASAFPSPHSPPQPEQTKHSVLPLAGRLNDGI